MIHYVKKTMIKQVIDIVNEFDRLPQLFIYGRKEVIQANLYILHVLHSVCNCIGKFNKRNSAAMQRI